MDALYSLAVMFHTFQVVKGRTTWVEEMRKRQLNNNHKIQRNVTCRWMGALYSLPVMFHAFPFVKGEQHEREKGENGNIITTTQCNAMSFPDEWVHYTHPLSCSMHSQLWTGEQREEEKGENGNLITTTQCNAMLLADEWMHYTHLLSCSMYSQL